MIEILEVWGNGVDVVIKFKRDVGGTWYAASKWMSVSYPYTDKFLKDNGYRRLKLERLTRVKDEYECRIKDCPAEDWMFDLYGYYSESVICDDCPFLPIVNKLAEYEDKEEGKKNNDL